MNVSPEVVEVARHWVRKAEHDLEAEESAAMSPYAVAVHYGDDWREPQREDAVRALALARRVRTEVRNLLPPDAVL